MDTAIHGKVEYVGIEDPNDPGTYIDVSEKAHNVRSAFAVDELDTTTFGQGDKTSKKSLRGATLSLDAYHDSTLRALLFAIYTSDDPVSIIYGPEGDGTGKQKYTADFNMTGFEDGATPSSLVGGSISFTRTGATTLGTFA